MNRRLLSLSLSAIMLLSVFSLATTAVPGEADQPPIALDCSAGDEGTPLITCGTDRDDTAQILVDALCAVHPSRCPVDALAGLVGTPPDLDTAFAELQFLVIDAAFQAIATDLSAVGLSFAPATGANGLVLDQDGDGSPDAWALTVDATNSVWVPSDVVNGPLSGGRGMFPSASASDHESGTDSDQDGGGEGGGEGQAVGPITITQDGDQTYINVTDPLDGTLFATITIDPTATPAGIGRNRVVVVDFHGNAPRQAVPGFSLYWAPLDFNHLVVSDPNDVDGDGFVTGYEHFTGDANGNLFANPVNTLSVPGDADGDGCAFGFPGEDDTDRRIDPCTILPYTINLLDIGAELGNPENIVWDTVLADIRIENITDTSFSEEESEIVSWELWWADADSLSAVRNTICDESDADLVVVGGVLDFACPWDSNEAPDTHDYLTAPPGPHRVDNYWAFLEICLAADVPCIRTSDGLKIIVQNLPSLKYHTVLDNPIETPDRDDTYAGLVNLTLETEHPAYAITEIEVQTRSAATFDTNGQVAAGIGGFEYGPWITLDTLPVDHHLVHRERNETGEFTDNYTIEIDTAPETFPKANAPQTPRAPRSNLEGLPFMSGLLQNWQPAGNEFRAVVKHSDGDTRMGEVVQDAEAGFYHNGSKIFNNRPPEISEYEVDFIDPSIPIVEFSFHYYDPDGTPTTEAKVQVNGRTVECVQQPANEVDALVGDTVHYMDHPSDFTCEWNAQGVTESEFPWNVQVVDVDGGDTPLSFLADVTINLGNQPPLLDGGSHEQAALPNPLGNGTTYTFSVHYSDLTDAPGEVTLVLESVGGAHAARNVTLSPCLLQDDPIAALTGDVTEVDFCVDVVLPSGSQWTYGFNATDGRGAAAMAVPPLAELEVPDVVCDHCFTEGDALSQAQTAFNSAIDALGSEGVPMPVNGYLLDDASGELFGPSQVDSDGDFVPDLVEAMLLGFEVFDVTQGEPGPQDDTASFHDQWVIEVKEPKGGGLASHSALTITISREEDAPFYSLDVCSGPEPADCVLHDQDLSLIDLATTPQGLMLIGYDVEGAIALSLVVDALNLGSVSGPFATIRVADMDIEIMSNPFDVFIDDVGTHPGGTTTTAGFDRDASGALLVYIDPNGGDGSDRIESGSVDPNAINPTDFLGAVDEDGDGYPDALEAPYCSVIGTSLGGSCQNGNFTPDN